MVKIAPVPRSAIGSEWSMFRYAAAMPIRDGELRPTLGEGTTPLDPAVFTYHLKVNRLSTGEEVVDKGTITLLR